MSTTETPNAVAPAKVTGWSRSINRPIAASATVATTTSPKKSLEEILQLDFKCHIIFQGTPPARTTSVSSATLKTATGKSKIWDVTLEDIRDCGKLSKAYLFCVNSTNTVADSTDLGHYISLTKENITALQDAAAGTSAILTLQYTSRHRPPPTEIPKPPTLTTSPADDSKPLEIKDKAPVAAKIDTAGLVVGSASVVTTHPAEMTDKEWNYVMTTNSLLHGMFFDTTSNTLQKARYPAFKLKASTLDPSPETKGDQLCAPAFEVKDESSVTITEVKSSFENSMAQHAFNSSSVEASVSGGFGAISAGVSASTSWSSSHSSASSRAGEMDRLHASYNFPRVKVFLDPDDLEISKGCQALLDTIEKPGSKRDDVVRFYRKYGHIFAGSVQLGGRLHTTKESKACKEASAEEKKDALKVAAAASISTPYVSGSFSASHGNSNESNLNKGSGKAAESLAWEAQGGETLFASNPPAWITTVGSFHNWRVIERNDVHDILTLLKDISGKDWPTIFQKIEGVQATAKDPLVFTGTHTDEIHITNDTDKTVQVAVSDASSLSESSDFHDIQSRQSYSWSRTGDQCVFINALDSNRVAIAKAQPGKYSIRELVSNDSNCTYHKASAGYIGIKNDTATSIHVKVTTPPKSGKSARFSEVRPGTTEYWGRTASEMIFVKHSSSSALLTYLGKPDYDLYVGNPSNASSPNFHFVKNSTVVKTTYANIAKAGSYTDANQSGSEPSTYMTVFNAQSSRINIKVSSATYDDGHENFYPIKAGQPESWHRFGEEVIYVNGPHGTAVGAYYGMLGTTLIVDHHITNDGK